MRKTKLYYLILLFVAAAIPSIGQGTLTGSVKTSQGEAIVGANVFIKGTSVGTTTDVNGVFALQTPAANAGDSISFSFIGYKTQTVLLSGRTQFDMVLADDAQTLTEVVVTGYQVQDKQNITGSVGVVSPELINKIPVSGIDQALQGRVPGVAVTQNTGAPGAGVSVRIRGLGSINSNNSPLYIVDGLPTLDITGIAPQDIATLQVLKDASESALYGSRAANGVVVITTKLGSTTKPTIQYTTQIGTQSPTRLIPMANTAQYINIFNEAVRNDNPTPGAGALIKDDPSTLPNVNWVKAIMRKSPLLQTHSLSFSGGDGKTRYLLAGSFYGQDGIIKASDYKRITMRLNIDSEIKKWLRTGINMNVSTATTDIIGASGDGAGGNGGSVVRYAYFRPSAVPIYTSTGAFVDKPGDYYTTNPSLYTNYYGDGYNPVGMLAYNNNRLTADRLFGKVYGILTPFKNFTFTSNFGLDYTSSLQRRFDRNWGDESAPGHGRINDPNTLSVVNSRSRNLTFSNFATYNPSFGHHNFHMLLGTEAIKNQTYTLNSSDQKFVDQTANLTYLGNGLGIKTQAESLTGNALLSYYGNVKYDYSGKYIASVIYRRDGSSRFGQNNRWGNFYAVSGGWHLEKEAFMNNNSWIDVLMLRAGYGVIGNQEIGNYPNQNILSNNYNYPFGGVKSTGYTVTSFGNPDVKWESSSQLNAGFNLSIYEGKLTLQGDYFSKLTTNLLVQQPLPSSLGSLAAAGSPYVNNGKVSNKGVELSLTYKNAIGDFHYAISPNAAFIHNEVVSVNTPIADGNIGTQTITLTEKGHPLGSFFLIQQAGIFQNAADVIGSAVPTAYQNKLQPGDVKYVDANHDGKIDQSDRVFSGSAIPKITGGLNIQLNYKNWDLSAFFQGAYGQKIFSVLNVDIEGFYRPFNVTERYYDNHWTAEHPSNKYPRATYGSSGNNTMYSTRFLEDGSYTRLKNLQVGYTVPQTFLHRYGFSTLRIYFSGTNLLTFTKYSGMDPEMTASDNAKNSGDRANGLDWGTYPSAKSYNLGLNVTF